MHLCKHTYILIHIRTIIQLIILPKTTADLERCFHAGSYIFISVILRRKLHFSTYTGKMVKGYSIRQCSRDTIQSHTARDSVETLACVYH